MELNQNQPEAFPRKARDNNVMHAKPDLRVFLKWMIAGSGSVITDVSRLKNAILHFNAADIYNAIWRLSCMGVWSLTS